MTIEYFNEALTDWIKATPAGIDLTNSDQLQQVNHLAEQMLEIEDDPDSLSKHERDLAEEKDDVPLLIHLAIKVARSRAIISRITSQLHISVVFAVYKEHERILSAAEHPLGEDFLRKKIEQLNWLFGGHSHFSWELIVVDDGCPENSGQTAEKIATEMGESRVRVLYLEKAIEAGSAVTRPMKNASESQKGGSIALGMHYAATRKSADHVVVFTDADLSTHLGQTGLLLDGIVNRGMGVAIGSRREDTSIAVKQGTRNTRGKLFIYLWKRLFPMLGHIVDTQCGFKAFRADCIPEIVSNMIEKRFAFDIELLLRAQLARAGSIEKVAIAWIDSEAASTTTSLQPYLSMLKTMIEMYRAYLPPDQEAESFAAFLESLNEEEWAALCEAVPEGIETREPFEFETWNGVSANTLKKSIRRPG